MDEINELKAKIRFCTAHHKYLKACIYLDELTSLNCDKSDVMPDMVEIVLHIDEPELTDRVIKSWENKLSNGEGDNNTLKHYICILYSFMKNKNRAEFNVRRILDSIVSSKSDRARVQHNLAMILYDMKKYAEADGNMYDVLEVFGEAEQCNAPYFSFMGDIKKMLGKYDEARKWYDKAIDSDPYETEWYKQCAKMMIKTKDYACALDYLNRLTSISKEDHRNSVCSIDSPWHKDRQYRKAIMAAEAMKTTCKKNDRKQACMPDTMPKTIEEAVKYAVAHLSIADKTTLQAQKIECLQELELSSFGTIRKGLGLWKENDALLAECGNVNMNPEEALRIILKEARQELLKEQSNIQKEIDVLMGVAIKKTKNNTTLNSRAGRRLK